MSLERLTGGSSHETWSFEAREESGARHDLILRRDFPGGSSLHPDEMIDRDDVLDRHGEFLLQRAIHEAGVAVPRPICEPSGIARSFVMERVDGESRPRVLARDERYAGTRLTREVGRALARLHSVDPAVLPPLPERPLDLHLDICRAMLDRGPEPRPALEFGLRWLRENSPAASATLRLVHGEFRNGNIVVDDGGLRTILDFEYAHLGHPEEDLAWLCLRPWRFGSDSREVGGFGAREDLYAGYEEGGGHPVDPAVVHYWEVFSQVKWGAACVLRCIEHLSGALRSVELAAIGRRVTEAEYDLLALID